MDAVIAERQEAHGLTQQAQGDLPGLSFPAGWRSDRKDQSDPAGLGEVLCDKPLQPVFLIHLLLGRDERFGAIWPGRANVQVSAGSGGAGNGCTTRWDSSRSTVFRIRSSNPAVARSDRSHNPLDRKCAGARSAGNPHATCDVAGTGIRFTVRLVRHSQRKRGDG
jgi:hypothetical protein